MKKIIILIFLSFFTFFSYSYAQKSGEEISKEGEKVIKDEVISCYKLGLVYGLNGRYEEAAKCLHKAIRLDPLYSEAYRILGVVYSLQNNYAEAIKNLEKAMQIDPKDKDAYRILKVICGLKDATEKLEELSEKEPSGKEKDYEKIKGALKGMQEEIEKLKNPQIENKSFSTEMNNKTEKKEIFKEMSKVVPLEELNPKESKDEKRSKARKSYAEILEEEKEVAFAEEEIFSLPFSPPKVISREEEKEKREIEGEIKSNVTKTGDNLELTITSIKGWWKKDKSEQIFYIEGRLKNTGFFCVYTPRVEAKIFCKNNLIGIVANHPTSKIEAGEMIDFKVFLPLSLGYQEELSYQIFIEEDVLSEKKRSVQLFMLVDGRKIQMPIIFP
ncbi:tetratricopeptide repeat protein [bacterium]|nr:tetratricopeptide repeat protein [bacterium]